jgi:hypothetical protein
MQDLELLILLYRRRKSSKVPVLDTSSSPWTRESTDLVVTGYGAYHRCNARQDLSTSVWKSMRQDGGLDGRVAARRGKAR